MRRQRRGEGSGEAKAEELTEETEYLVEVEVEEATKT